MENSVLLKQALEELGLAAEDNKINQLMQFKDILLEWNEKINLTTITEEKEVYIKHFIDSVTCLQTGYIKQNHKVIDVGTGAGFPGVPIKILAPDLELTLLDSLNKRIQYLKDVADRLKLEGVTLVHARAEEGGQNPRLREGFDIVLSRAVASMSILCEYCLPFAKVGGYFICQKGPKYQEELKEAEKAIQLLGGEIREVKAVQLPHSDITHYIIIIQKVSSTPTKYPRKPGKPASDPIL